jgi:hypothetical protein
LATAMRKVAFKILRQIIFKMTPPTPSPAARLYIR